MLFRRTGNRQGYLSKWFIHLLRLSVCWTNSRTTVTKQLREKWPSSQEDVQGFHGSDILEVFKSNCFPRWATGETINFSHDALSVLSYFKSSFPLGLFAEGKWIIWWNILLLLLHKYVRKAISCWREREREREREMSEDPKTLLCLWRVASKQDYIRHTKQAIQ